MNAFLYSPDSSFLPLYEVKKGRGDVKRANGKVSRLKYIGSLALLEMAIAIEQEGSISASS
jgi:hypothetical protein